MKRMLEEEVEEGIMSLGFILLILTPRMDCWWRVKMARRIWSQRMGSYSYSCRPVKSWPVTAKTRHAIQGVENPSEVGHRIHLKAFQIRTISFRW